MTRRILPLIALLAGSLLISLGIGEAFFRALGHKPRQIVAAPHFWEAGWAAMDAELGWVPRVGTFRSIEPGNAAMTFAADGRRHDPLEPKGALRRILVVGCSFTQGEGVGDDEPYAHVINRALPGFEVLNFGTGGYGTYQSLLRVQSYFRGAHAPTPLVIYGLTGHHIVRNVAPAGWVTMLTTRDGRYLVPPHVRLEGNRLTAYPAEPVPLWPLETRSALVATLHGAVLNLTRRAYMREQTEALRRLLRDMKRTSEANGAALIVVRLASVANSTVAMMQQEGIDFIDCEVPDDQDPAFRVGGIGHPNGRLHQLWGNCVLRGLAGRGYAVAPGALSAVPQR
jgi:hypothetical protein